MATLQTQYYKIRLKKNDLVQVISGRDKGKTGKVTFVDLKNGMVTVEGLNMIKRHTRPTQKSPQGGITTREAPLHCSKVLLFSPDLNKGVRFEKAKTQKDQALKPKKGKK